MIGSDIDSKSDRESRQRPQATMADPFEENSRRSARRASRLRQKLVMEEAASGPPASAGPVLRGAATEDRGDSGGTSHPPREAFQAFGVVELFRDRYAPVQEEDNSFPDCTGDVILFGGDGAEEEEFNPSDVFGGGMFDAAATGLTGSFDFFPKFSDAGTYSGCERRAHNVLHPSERDKKKYFLAFALLLFFGSITLAVSLTTRKNMGYYYLGVEMMNPKHHPTPAKNPTETATFTTHNLSVYGYPYAQGTSSTGWVTWIPGRRYMEDDPNHVSYDESDGVSSLQDCAATCHQVKAPTASWSSKYKTCWCNFSIVTNLCREPCVEDEYIDFGTVPIDGIGYCKMSVCDEEWFLRDPEYCDGDVGFDRDACSAKKEEIGRSPSPAPTHLRK